MVDIDLAVDDQGLKQPPPSQHEVIRGEVLVLILPFVSSAEGSFHREDVRDVKLLKHRQPSCGFLLLTH